MTTATKAGGAVLPVVAWLRDGQKAAVSDPVPLKWYPEKWKPLVRLSDAQATIDELRADNENWKAVVWAVARELNCLPSTFSDGNAHVLKAAIKLTAELSALEAKQIDVEAVMRLADEYAEQSFLRAQGEKHTEDAAREALRASLLGDGGTAAMKV